MTEKETKSDPLSLSEGESKVRRPTSDKPVLLVGLCKNSPLRRLLTLVTPKKAATKPDEPFLQILQAKNGEVGYVLEKDLQDALVDVDLSALEVWDVTRLGKSVRYIVFRQGGEVSMEVKAATVIAASKAGAGDGNVLVVPNSDSSSVVAAIEAFVTRNSSAVPQRVSSPQVKPYSTPPQNGKLLGPFHSRNQAPPPLDLSGTESPSPELEGGEQKTDGADDPAWRLFPVIIVGPTGVGKTALLQRLISECPSHVRRCITTTTRIAKAQEVSEYEHVTREEFRNLKLAGTFFQHYRRQQGLFYGIKQSQIDEIQTQGLTPVMDVDQRGLYARDMRRQIGRVRVVYVTAPPDELENRLTQTMLMKDMSKKDMNDALQDSGKKSEFLGFFRKWVDPANFMVLENIEFDSSYIMLKNFVLHNRVIRREEALLQLESLATPLHGVTIVVEPSGMGGSRLINRLRSEHSDVGIAVSHTTRERKGNEVDGTHYHFVTESAFRKKYLNGEFLEFARVGGNFYGITKQEFKRVLQRHNKVVVKVNVGGARSIKRVHIGARFVLMCGKLQGDDELRARWEETEGPLPNEEVERRKAVLREEILEAEEIPFYFNLVIDVNDPDCYSQLRDFVLKGHKQKGDSIIEKVDPDMVDTIVFYREGMLNKATMKSDHFPSGKQRGLDEDIEGAPNFRCVAVGPDPNRTGMAHTFYGVAQPTVDGFRRVFMRLLRGKPPQTKILVVNLREELVMYINRRPFCLKNLEDLYSNTSDPFSSKEKVQDKETRLKTELINEAKKYGKRLLVHDEEHKAGELAAWGEIYAYWEDVTNEEITCPNAIMKQFTREGFNVQYLRLPITDEQPPKDQDLDTLTRALWQLHLESPDSPVLFNCQLGRGRTTTATLLSLLFLFPPRNRVLPAVSEYPGFGELLEHKEDGRGPVEFDQDNSEPEESLAETEDGQETYFGHFSELGRSQDRKYRRRATETAVHAEEKWNCVQQLFEMFRIPKYVEHHFREVIEACAHIQNLRMCVEDAQNDCMNATDPARKQKTWIKTKNYLKRYYYIALAATHFHTECTGEYYKWRAMVTDGPPNNAGSKTDKEGKELEEPHTNVFGTIGSPCAGSSKKKPIRGIVATRTEFRNWVEDRRLWKYVEEELDELRVELDQAEEAHEKGEFRGSLRPLNWEIEREGDRHRFLAPELLKLPSNPMPGLKVIFTVDGGTVTEVVTDATSPEITPNTPFSHELPPARDMNGAQLPAPMQELILGPAAGTALSAVSPASAVTRRPPQAGPPGTMGSVTTPLVAPTPATALTPRMHPSVPRESVASPAASTAHSVVVPPAATPTVRVPGAVLYKANNWESLCAAYIVWKRWKTALFLPLDAVAMTPGPSSFPPGDVLVLGVCVSQDMLLHWQGDLGGRLLLFASHLEASCLMRSLLHTAILSGSSLIAIAHEYSGMPMSLFILFMDRYCSNIAESTDDLDFRSGIQKLSNTPRLLNLPASSPTTFASLAELESPVYFNMILKEGDARRGTLTPFKRADNEGEETS